MFKPINEALSRLAQRCLALAAGMLATTIESLQIVHQAEMLQQLEDTASRFESEGQPEIAQQIRERTKSMATDDPAARGEALLRQLSEVIPTRAIASADSAGPDSLSDDAGQRRLAARAKRTKAAISPENPETAPNGELFFSLRATDSSKVEGGQST